MELLERYLAAVGNYLPAEQRVDIIAELRSDLTLQFEGRQAEFGHPLSTEEAEALLKAYGHPVAVAAPYRSQRPLIGPLLLPWYWLSLRVVLGIWWITELVIAGIRIGASQDLTPLLEQLAQRLWNTAILATGTVTIFAAILDRLGAERWLAHWLGQMAATWHPRDLPQLVPPPRMPTPNLPVALDLIVLGLIILWMTGLADALVAPIASITHWRFTPIVFALRWPVLLISVAQTSLDVMRAIRPDRTLLRRIVSPALKAVVLCVLFSLLRHWPFWQLVDIPPANAAVITHGVNVGLSLGLGIALGVIALVTVLGLLWDLGNLREKRR